MTALLCPSPIKYVEPSLPDAPEKVNCPKFVDSSVVYVIKFPEDSVLQFLQHKFTEVSAQGFTAPCLPRVAISKSIKDLVNSVNDSLERVLENCDPSLQQCTSLISCCCHCEYTAARITGLKI